MRIGIVPNLDRAAGGTFQYAVTMVRALEDLELDDEVAVFLYAGESLPPQLEDIQFPIETLRTMPGAAGRLWTTVSRLLPPALRARLRTSLARVLSAGRRDQG